MNKLQQDTLEVIQEYLPRIAVALEEIAKELKEQSKLDGVGNSNSTESDTIRLSKSEAYHRIRRADIPVTEYDNGDILISGDLVIGECIAYLSPKIEGNKIVTSYDEWIYIKDLTLDRVDKFILEYKTLEKEISK